MNAATRRPGSQDGARIAVAPSRANALILAALGAALIGVTMMLQRMQAYSDWMVGFVPLIGFLSMMLLGCALGLGARRRPAFAADAATIAMPYGMLSLARFDWDEIEAWGIAERRVPWFPLLTQRVFAVWLRHPDRLPRVARQEIWLNRRVIGADLILSDWFVPNGFDTIIMTCRRLRPDLEKD